MRDRSLQSQTICHYDRNPFDAITSEDEKEPKRIQPRPFIEFCERWLHSRMSVAEIGCGPGRGTMFLAANGLDVTAIDISAGSLERARRRTPKAAFVRATAMMLP